MSMSTATISASLTAFRAFRASSLKHGSRLQTGPQKPALHDQNADFDLRLVAGLSPACRQDVRACAAILCDLIIENGLIPSRASGRVVAFVKLAKGVSRARVEAACARVLGGRLHQNLRPSRSKLTASVRPCLADCKCSVPRYAAPRSHPSF